MRIYVSHKRTEDNPQFYDLKILDHNFIFPHEVSQQSFNTKELFQNKSCDLVLAEVSEPSTGQGIELGWANLLGIPVLCVYKTGSKISNSLKQVTKNFIEYDGIEDLQTKVAEALK